MNELIARLAALFVEPRTTRAVARDAARDRRAYASATVVVLGDARAVRAAVAVAAALARAGRAPCALLCTAAAPVGVTVPPLPAAARAAAKLRARGLDARAHGRVVILTVPGEADGAAAAPAPVDSTRAADSAPAAAAAAPAGAAADPAAATLARAHAAVAARHDVPAVLALCGPRSEAVDDALGAHDLVLVLAPAGSDPLLADVAVARLCERHPSLRVARAELGRSGRLAPPPRAAVRAVLEGLR